VGKLVLADPRAFAKLPVTELADRGCPYPAALTHEDDRSQADDSVWRLRITLDPWSLPAGAFGERAGPT
jgi:hypothetical protein